MSEHRVGTGERRGRLGQGQRPDSGGAVVDDLDSVTGSAGADAGFLIEMGLHDGGLRRSRGTPFLPVGRRTHACAGDKCATIVLKRRECGQVDAKVIGGETRFAKPAAAFGQKAPVAFRLEKWLLEVGRVGHLPAHVVRDQSHGLGDKSQDRLVVALAGQALITGRDRLRIVDDPGHASWIVHETRGHPSSPASLSPRQRAPLLRHGRECRRPIGHPAFGREQLRGIGPFVTEHPGMLHDGRGPRVRHGLLGQIHNHMMGQIVGAAGEVDGVACDSGENA